MDIDGQNRRGWIPVQLHWKPEGVMLNWCQVGKHEIRRPFFDHDVENLFGNSFRLLFQYEEPIEAYCRKLQDVTLVEPDGFIFHMSRCGSTLASQLLNCVSQTLVISEPSLIRSILECRATEDQRIRWLRAALNGMKTHRSDEDKLFIKFDSVHTVYLSLICRAFPTTPWIFLYRNPSEVLVSLHRDPGRLAIGDSTYHAKILTTLIESAIEHADRPQAHFVNYSKLPHFIPEQLADIFSFSCSPEVKNQMMERARFGGKTPTDQHESDTQSKQAQAVELGLHKNRELGDLFNTLKSLGD